MTFMPFTDQWKSQRKLLHTMTQPRAATTYEPIQAEESAQLVRDMLRAPQDYWSHCQRYAGSTIMQIAFNKRALSITDPAIVDMRRINDQMTKTAVPGRYLVDSVPILNLVPERWASWKREASTLFEDTLRLFRSHVDDVSAPVFKPIMPSTNLSVESRCTAKCKAGATSTVSQRPSSRTRTNTASRTTKRRSSREQCTAQEVTPYVPPVSLYLTLPNPSSPQTADMISTAIMTFTKYPTIVRAAQAELDRIVGRDRLPDFSDEKDLVYCSAVIREIMRWRTVIAGSLAHASIKDDFYDGTPRFPSYSPRTEPPY